MKRLGVLLCSCGSVIKNSIDLEELAKRCRASPYVQEVQEEAELCQVQGLDKLKEFLKAGSFDGLVIAACSSRSCEHSFKAVAELQLLPTSLVEVVDIRELCSAVHPDKKDATEKAYRLINGGVMKVATSPPLRTEKIKVVKKALVVGGGIAGVQCSLDIANAGYEVFLVEKEPSIGGVMSQLDKTIPTLDCSICMPGDQEVILTDGTVIEIGELVDRLWDKRKNAFNPHPRSTYSYMDHTLLDAEIVGVQKLPSPPKFIAVQTSTGMILRFTHDHKIMIDTCNGPSWIKCSELKPGDMLYAPRQLNLNETSEVSIVDLLPEGFRIADRNLIDMIRLRPKASSNKWHRLKLKDRGVSIGELKRSCETMGLDWGHIKRKIKTITYQGANGNISIESRIIDDKVMYLLGLLASNGNVEAHRIRFYNTENSLIKLFRSIYGEMFPTRASCISYINPKSRNQKKRMVVQVKNKLLFEIANKLEVKRSLKPIFHLDKRLIAAFLKGFFDGAGYVKLSKHPDWATAKIKFSLGDEYDYGYRLHLLLKRLGILSKVYKYGKRVIVDISERRDVLQFAKEVGSCHPRKALILRKIVKDCSYSKQRGGLFEQLPLECGKLLSELRQRYHIPLRVFPLSHSNVIRILRQQCRITRENLILVLDAIKEMIDSHDPDYLRLQKILHSSFFLDRVKVVNVVSSTDRYVYDVTVQDTHNFIPNGAFVVSNCIEGPKLSDAGRNRNIRLIPNAEVTGIAGHVGNFDVTVEVRPTFVDPSKCNGCGACVDVCPVYQPNRYDVDLKPIKAIYAPFAQAVPLKYVINKDICTECGMCQKACGLSAINFNDHPKTIMLNVGAIVIATGASLFDPKLKPQYHYGEFENVISSIEFERVICASGPSGGELVLRNRKHPKRIAFIQCVGSRDTSIGAEDCSLFCCAVSLKQARLIKEHDPKAEVYIFYTDIRAQGKGWEDLYTRVREDGVRFIRCRPSELRRDRESGEIVIPYEDSLTGERGELKVDLVVLALGMRPSESTTKLAKIAGLQTRDPGWIEEIQPKFRPLETFVDGIFIAGTCHGPRDISESVIEGSGAAGLVLSIFNASELALSPFKASVDKLVCTGCMRCQSACEYGAITSDDGKAAVNEGVCKGCGACVPACLPGAISLKGWQQESVLSQVEGILEVP